MTPSDRPEALEREREVLGALGAALTQIGSANDAEDHHYLDEAVRLRSESCDAARVLLADYPWLSSVLPTLESELASGHVLGFGWADLLTAIREYLMRDCEICAALAAQEYAFQKYGWSEGSYGLPAESQRLEVVRDLKPDGGDRLLQLMRCPICGTNYLYRTDYEYLTNGTEDEQFLTRLSAEETAGHLRQAGASPGEE